MTYVASPPDMAALDERIDADRLFEILRISRAADRPDRYPHWDRLRHLEPPGGITREEWWFGIKVGRVAGAREIPLVDIDGRPFSYSLPDPILRRLLLVDQRCSGEIAMAEVVTADPEARRRYLVNSLMEEAIRSSQLEGASTSRRVAKELLRSGREPRDRSERMIRNNYFALQFMRDEVGSRLTTAHVLELHRILTDGTLDDPDTSGRLQGPEEERIAVLDRNDGRVLHAPPPAIELPQRLRTLCDFANDDGHGDGATFVHPVVRAILLHFGLAYDHPFADGNGRTARALFYWYLRERGYWLVEYLSISRILSAAPAAYVRAYLLTETDEGDTTYFLIQQLEVIERAIDELHGYLRRKVGEIQEVEGVLKGAGAFNHRQLALLGDALRGADRRYTFGGHATSHAVTHETARSDLSGLTDAGLLNRHRTGRQYYFTAPSDLLSRLRRLR